MSTLELTVTLPGHTAGVHTRSLKAHYYYCSCGVCGKQRTRHRDATGDLIAHLEAVVASREEEPVGKLSVLSSKGDITIEWKPDDAESVEAAKKEWAALAEAGFEFYKPADGGGRGQRVKQFRKSYGWVIAAPGVQKRADREHAKRTHTAAPRKKAMAGGPRASSTLPPEARMAANMIRMARG